MKKYDKLLTEVPVYDTVPRGWSEIKGAQTAPRGYKWISNNKSYFGGERKQALVKENNNSWKSNNSAEIRKGSKNMSNNKTKFASKPTKQTHTAEERAAWGAGAAWAMGKSGKQIRCKPENSESFRAGVKAARKSPNRFTRSK